MWADGGGVSVSVDEAVWDGRDGQGDDGGSNVDLLHVVGSRDSGDEVREKSLIVRAVVSGWVRAGASVRICVWISVGIRHSVCKRLVVGGWRLVVRSGFVLVGR